MDDIIPNEIPIEYIFKKITIENADKPKKVEELISTQKFLDIKKSNLINNIERLNNRKESESNPDEIQRLQLLINLQESELININETDVDKK